MTSRRRKIDPGYRQLVIEEFTKWSLKPTKAVIDDVAHMITFGVEHESFKNAVELVDSLRIEVWYQRSLMPNIVLPIKGSGLPYPFVESVMANAPRLLIYDVYGI